MPLVKPGARGTPSPAAADSPAVDRHAADPIAALASAVPGERRQGALALAGRPDAVAALADRLAVEDDPGVREAILTALVRSGTDEAVAGLLPLLACEDAGLRNDALESLQQMPPEVAVPRVAPLLDHPDSDLRIFAVQLIAQLPHPTRLDRLVGVVESDPHVNVCLAAVEGLVESARPEAVPALRRLQGRFPDDPMVGHVVESACRRFREA